MNEGIHLDLDTWIVPGQIRKANLCRGLGNRHWERCLLLIQIQTNRVIINKRPLTPKSMPHTLSNAVYNCIQVLNILII